MAHTWIILRLRKDVLDDKWTEIDLHDTRKGARENVRLYRRYSQNCRFRYRKYVPEKRPMPSGDIRCAATEDPKRDGHIVAFFKEGWTVDNLAFHFNIRESEVQWILRDAMRRGR
jgi:hypothetical protein